MFWNKETIRQVEEAMRLRAARPAHEQWQEMIDRGVIDRDGNVILKRPEWGGQMYPGQPRPAGPSDPDLSGGSA